MKLQPAEKVLKATSLSHLGRFLEVTELCLQSVMIISIKFPLESRCLTCSIEEFIFEQDLQPSMVLQQWLDLLPKAKETPLSS